MTRTMHVTDPCHGQVITLDHVGFDYEGQQVFENVNFTVRERDFVGVIGANGAGKTTLLRLMVGLLRPTAGEVRLFGTPIQRFKQWERVGYVPQKNSFNPLFPATGMEVVKSGMYNRRRLFRRLSKPEISQCIDAMAAMRIEDLAHKRIGQLSGGQQQRVFLARAMVLAERTVGIVAGSQMEFFSLLQHLHEHHRMTFVMVSHDLDLVNSWLGDEPAGTCGKFHFYVKHSHEAECLEPGLTHGVNV